MTSVRQIEQDLSQELLLLNDHAIRSLALDMGISYDTVSNCHTRAELLDQIVSTLLFKDS